MEENSSQTKQPVLPGNFPSSQPPPKEAWWQFPKTVYIIIIIIFVLSISSSAYLFFAPSTVFNPGAQPSPTLRPAMPTVTSEPTPSGEPTPTNTPAPLQSPTPTPDYTAGWSKYSNYEYKFSFLYPPGWKVTDTGNLEPKVPSYLSINQSTASASLHSITVSSSTRTYDEESVLHSSTRTSLIVNGLSGFKTEEKNSEGSMSIHVVLKGSTYTYILIGKKTYESTFNLLYPTFTPL
jgi:hypothetical protein